MDVRMLDDIPLPEQSVYEGDEGRQLRRVIGRGWLFGIPVMFAISLLVLYLATRSTIGILIVAGWGAIVAGPYFGGFVLLNRGALALDLEADLEPASGDVDGTALARSLAGLA